MDNYYEAEYMLSDSILSPIGRAKTIDDLIKIALPVRTSIRVKFTWGEEGDVANYYDEKFEKHYNYNSGVISFFYNGVFYSIPSSNKAERILEANRFVFDRNMYVMCNMTPIDDKDYWEKVRNESDGLDALEAATKLTELADKPYERIDGRPVEEISEEAKRRSFRIPDNGIIVKFPEGEEEYKPKVGVTQENIGNTAFLGTFCTNNGTMVFHTPSGTYVTRSRKVYEEVASKYEQKSCFVPFSNGERPVIKHDAEVLGDVFLSDEEYERKHGDEKASIKREIAEATSKTISDQQRELEEVRRQLAEAKRTIEELRGKEEPEIGLSSPNKTF